MDTSGKLYVIIMKTGYFFQSSLFNGNNVFIYKQMKQPDFALNRHVKNAHSFLDPIIFRGVTPRQRGAEKNTLFNDLFWQITQVFKCVLILLSGN